MVKVGQMLRTHFWGILNAVVLRATDAHLEAVNPKIQALKKRACGYRNRKRFRNAILFHSGGLDLYPVNAVSRVGDSAVRSVGDVVQARAWARALDHDVVEPEGTYRRRARCRRARPRENAYFPVGRSEHVDRVLQRADLAEALLVVADADLAASTFASSASDRLERANSDGRSSCTRSHNSKSLQHIPASLLHRLRRNRLPAQVPRASLGGEPAMRIKLVRPLLLCAALTLPLACNDDNNAEAETNADQDDEGCSPGELNCECNADQCLGGLQCVEGMCVSSCIAGELGCDCNAGQCLGGLECTGDICTTRTARPASWRASATMGSASRTSTAWGTCARRGRGMGMGIRQGMGMGIRRGTEMGIRRGTGMEIRSVRTPTR